jgi:hypothetical protein
MQSYDLLCIQRGLRKPGFLQRKAPVFMRFGELHNLSPIELVLQYLFATSESSKNVDPAICCETPGLCNNSTVARGLGLAHVPVRLVSQSGPADRLNLRP